MLVPGVVKCPACSQDVIGVNLKQLAGALSGAEQKIPCVALCCPACNVVWSAQLDPLSVQSMQRKTPTAGQEPKT